MFSILGLFMGHSARKRIVTAILGILPVSPVAHATDATWDRNGPLPFGVSDQRTVTLTAQYRDPIPDYVGRRAAGATVGQPQAPGFVAATHADNDNYRAFHKAHRAAR